MRRIHLKNDSRYALVDNEDFEKVGRLKWWFSASGHRHGNGYAINAVYSPKLKKTKTILMHRLIMEFPEGKHVDHINGNGLDNRKKNLRACSRQENVWSSSKHKNKRVPYKGVSLTRDGKYQVRIADSGRQMYLGVFSTAISARRAYLKKARELHGEFVS